MNIAHSEVVYSNQTEMKQASPGWKRTLQSLKTVSADYTMCSVYFLKWTVRAVAEECGLGRELGSLTSPKRKDGNNNFNECCKRLRRMIITNKLQLNQQKFIVLSSGKRDRTILLLEGRPLSGEGVKDFSGGLIKCRLWSVTGKVCWNHKSHVVTVSLLFASFLFFFLSP